jgi:SH3 domain protein
MRRFITLLALAVAAITAEAQEILYITDMLQLGLHRTEDASDDPIRNLVSGTEVTILERIPNFARVRTSAGEEGWVKSAFLVPEKPAQLRIAEVEAERDRLEQELAAALLTQDTAMADAEQLAADAASVIAAVGQDSESLAELHQENVALEEQIDRYRGSVPWLWAVGALVVALGAGFVAGYGWLDASIRS